MFSPGTKLAQFFSLVYLYLFDHDLKRCFHVGECPALVEYYTKGISRKVSRRPKQNMIMRVIQRDPISLGQVRGYLNRLDFCYRLADDVLILHEDTVFLHLVIEWIGLYYANELRIGLNRDGRSGT